MELDLKLAYALSLEFNKVDTVLLYMSIDAYGIGIGQRRSTRITNWSFLMNEMREQALQRDLVCSGVEGLDRGTDMSMVSRLANTIPFFHELG